MILTGSCSVVFNHLISLIPFLFGPLSEHSNGKSTKHKKLCKASLRLGVFRTAGVANHFSGISEFRSFSLSRSAEEKTSPLFEDITLL